MNHSGPRPQVQKPAKRLKKRGYHHGDLKAAMVAAALDLIAERGPRGFSLSEAAKLAGVSVGAPYRHFADKEALFSAVAEQGFIELCRRMEVAVQTNPDDPRQRLLALGKAYVQFATEHPSHFQVMFESAIHRRKDAAVDEPAARAFQILKEAVQQASRGSIRNEETLIAATWSLLHGLAIFGMDGTFASMSFRTPLETLVEDAIQLLIP